MKLRWYCEKYIEKNEFEDDRICYKEQVLQYWQESRHEDLGMIYCLPEGKWVDVPIINGE